MPSFLCCALLSVPTSTSHLVSDTASVEQAALSSLYLCFFHVLLCMVCVLKPVWIRHVDNGRVVLCSIISPTQASKALLFARATATVDAIVPFEVPLTSVRLKYKCFFQPSFWHPLPCHVLFQHGWGDWMVVYLDVFQYSTSKGLRRNISFLCPLLVPLPCSFEGSICFVHKTLAYLFLWIC